MKHLLKYSLLLLLLPLLSLSCKKKEGSIIPRATLSEIYAEMFVVDQLLLYDHDLRRMADTSWVYEPILEKYGFTAEDFRQSMIYYLNDSDRYARILKQTGIILEDRLKQLKKEEALNESANKILEEIQDFKPSRIYCLTGLKNKDLMKLDSLDVYVDSTGGDIFFDVNNWADTIYQGPIMELDRASVDITVIEDSLAKTDLKLSGIRPDQLSVVKGQGKTIKPKSDEKGFSKISLYN